MAFPKNQKALIGQPDLSLIVTLKQSNFMRNKKGPHNFWKMYMCTMNVYQGVKKRIAFCSDFHISLVFQQVCEFKQSVLEDPETILQPSLLCHSHFLCHKNSLKMILPCTQPLKFLLDRAAQCYYQAKIDLLRVQLSSFKSNQNECLFLIDF